MTIVQTLRDLYALHVQLRVVSWFYHYFSAISTEMIIGVYFFFFFFFFFFFNIYLKSLHISTINISSVELLIATILRTHVHYMNLNATKCTFGHSDISSRKQQNAEKCSNIRFRNNTVFVI